MIDRFGNNPATVPTLLQFLTILPEEVTNNHKIPITVMHTPALSFMSFAHFLDARMTNSMNEK
jgi:hypothetical protein